MFPFYANFSWDYVPRLNSKRGMSRETQVNCVPHNKAHHLNRVNTLRNVSCFARYFERWCHTREKKMVHYVVRMSRFNGRTLDHTLFLQIKLLVFFYFSDHLVLYLIDIKCNNRSKYSSSKLLQVWPTKVCWQSAVQSLKSGRSWMNTLLDGRIYYQQVEFVLASNQVPTLTLLPGNGSPGQLL